MTLQLLGGLTVKQFLSRHWQQRPLLVRQAMQDFKAIVQPAELLRLAQRDDVESRWVARTGRRWEARNGPFSRAELARAPDENWTLLVQGVNLHHRAADELLRHFAFIPHARLDDVMISYAAPGGGVGPHLDSYDVFLLQSSGRRRWRVGPVEDASLIRGAPLKLLRHFKPTQEWVLEPGDMLYLPPGYAHDGVALDACTTCSIGFRAPTPRELGRALLARLEETLDERLVQSMYSDRGLHASSSAGRIPSRMARFAQASARRALSRPEDMALVLGEHLSEPKAHVVFTPPRPALPVRTFMRRAAAAGLRLDARTRLLYDAKLFYINGEAMTAPTGASRVLRRLADKRLLLARELLVVKPGSECEALLNGWYRAGWLHAGSHASP